MTYPPSLPGETTHASPATDPTASWTVEILAETGALSRIVDLMAKLDIEPTRIEATREPSGDAMRVCLEVDAGGSEGYAARFVQRLSGIIQIHSVASTPEMRPLAPRG